MVTAGPMASDGVATEESSRAPSSKFVHHRQQKFEVVQRDSWGGKPRHLVVEGGKGKNGNFGRKGGNQKSGGEASNSNGWLGGARGERHPQSGETRHCRFGTHCKYMHKYCPFVHVHTDGGKGQVSPTKVENYWSALRGRDLAYYFSAFLSGHIPSRNSAIFSVAFSAFADCIPPLF